MNIIQSPPKTSILKKTRVVKDKLGHVKSRSTVVISGRRKTAAFKLTDEQTEKLRMMKEIEEGSLDLFLDTRKDKKLFSRSHVMKRKYQTGSEM